MSSPAVFLDRDGTINEEMEYPDRLEQILVFPQAAPAIRRLNEAGLKVVVVTNQSGVARRYFPLAFVHEVHQYLNEHLAAAGAHFDGLYVCPHHPEDGCLCRKPKPGLILRAARDLNLDLAHSYMVGDRYNDLETAANAGVKGILVLTGYGRGEFELLRDKASAPPVYVAQDLADAAAWILKDLQKG
ncbi:MAG: HAD family hydrolase [Deltaproteobacteria bacterium]|nr:HAD family hydrolase [Deltaproteobacteria bacterium]